MRDGGEHLGGGGGDGTGVQQQTSAEGRKVPQGRMPWKKGLLPVGSASVHWVPLLQDREPPSSSAWPP